jgi:hypothetical protein
VKTRHYWPFFTGPGTPPLLTPFARRRPALITGNSYNFVPTLSLNVIKTFLEGTVLPTLASAESTYNTVKAAE